MRKKYFILTILTMILGLLSRKFMYYIPNSIAPYLGDILWATMVYFGFRFLLPKLNTNICFLIAITFSFLIEFSQIYQAQWINNIRATLIGSLILGHGFLWSDLVCYTIGILIGCFIDKLTLKKNSKVSKKP
ncbi:DUF2809 domain-containing protein [Clostridium sp.]|uniref:ribosomal maturation YjgA family protein n=1 Tax=Clostridium sp. TaxID=1506 RepID=UPI0026240024